jgi:L-arabonate dehydrase
LAKRHATWRAPEPSMKAGYQGLYVKHVQQANTGADLDFLVGCRGSTVLRESH